MVLRVAIRTLVVPVGASFPQAPRPRGLSDRGVLPVLGLPEKPLLMLGLSVRSGFL
jgi:hypothetical protein